MAGGFKKEGVIELNIIQLPGPCLPFTVQAGGQAGFVTGIKKCKPPTATALFYLFNKEKMHEFSIAMSIIEIAEAEARKAEATAITQLVLDIGTLSGIEFQALDTAMEMAVKNTMLENAGIIVNKIQARARCSDCGEEFNIENIFDACPKCDGLYHELLCGKELQIKSLVVDAPER